MKTRAAAETASARGMPAAFELAGVGLHRAGTGRVLEGVNLSISLGHVTALVGPSGSGKSSLLRLLNRLEEPTRGKILYRGERLANYPVRELRRRVGFVAQEPVLFPGSVEENLQVAAELAQVPTAGREAAIRAALQAAELEPALLDRSGERLSGGEKQRVTIARALVAAPDVLLMDEPTSALDSATADRLVATVLRMSRQLALTVILVTHRVDEARQIAAYTAILEQGRITRTGPTREVLGYTGGPHQDGSR
jgi:putative ABC transport system ATP-binding protein